MELGGLYRKVLARNIPLFACLEITTVCNNRCVHCYNAGEHYLSFGEIRECMDDAADMGTLFLSITGGEPLMHSDIWKILEYARSRHFAVLLYTNATLIGEEEARRIRDIGVYHVDTTLLGATADTHDRLAGVHGAFRKSLKALEELTRMGINVAVKTPVMKHNAEEIREIRDILGRIGITYIASPLIFARDNGDEEPLKYRPDDAQIIDFFSDFSSGGLAEDCAGYTCHFGKCTFAVRANGDVNPCISVPMSLGNVRQRRLKDIWSNNSILDDIRAKSAKPIEGCRQCDMARWCFRCEGISFTEEGELFKPSEELCRLARIRREVYHERAGKS